MGCCAAKTTTRSSMENAQRYQVWAGYRQPSENILPNESPQPYTTRVASSCNRNDSTCVPATTQQPARAPSCIPRGTVYKDEYDMQIEFPVTVHVYSLDALNTLMAPVGLRAYHSEVDIMGTLFAFGGLGQTDETREVKQSGVYCLGDTVPPQGKSTAPRPGVLLRCEQQHQLEPQGASWCEACEDWESFPHIRCDGCDTFQPVSSSNLTCHACGYNLCSACITKRCSLYQVLENNTPLDDCEPRSNIRGATFVETLYMGKAKMSKRQLIRILNKYMSAFQASSYRLLHNNCNHFASQLCTALTGNALPDWVNKAATVGAGLESGIGAVANKLSWLGAGVTAPESTPAPHQSPRKEMLVPAKRLQRKASSLVITSAKPQSYYTRPLDSWLDFSAL